MSTRTKIIIVIAVAVLVYVAWRRGWFGRKAEAVVTDPETDDSIQGIINRTSMTQLEKEKALGWVATIQNAAKNGKGGWSVEAIKERANNNNVTYNRQLVLDAVYQMYATGNMFSIDYCKGIMNEIKTM